MDTQHEGIVENLACSPRVACPLRLACACVFVRFLASRLDYLQFRVTHLMEINVGWFF